MSLLGAENIRLLKNLFKSENEDTESEDEAQGNGANGSRQLGPADIGTNTSSHAKKKRDENPDEHIKSCSYNPLQKTDANEPKTIEEWERQQELECENLLESRPRPEFRISYKQTVATEDLYLQMSGKTPSTASCESMVVEVFLNGETVGIHHIELAVEEQRIIVKSPKYYLDLALPHKVDPDKGSAVWLSEEKILKLTLKMEREFDFVNF